MSTVDKKIRGPKPPRLLLDHLINRLHAGASADILMTHGYNLLGIATHIPPSRNELPVLARADQEHAARNANIFRCLEPTCEGRLLAFIMKNLMKQQTIVRQHTLEIPCVSSCDAALAVFLANAAGGFACIDLEKAAQNGWAAISIRTTDNRMNIHCFLLTSQLQHHRPDRTARGMGRSG